MVQKESQVLVVNGSVPNQHGWLLRKPQRTEKIMGKIFSSQFHPNSLYFFRGKLVPQESQGLRVKMAKMDHLENPVQMDCRELLEKG